MGAASSVRARIDHTVTSGTFSLDGQTFEVDNNVWVVGDEHECVVIDAPHDVESILEVVGERRVVAVLCTHAHDDHVRVAPELGRAVEAPVLLHPADLPVWRLTHADPPDGELADGQQIPIADIALEVIHTPGHAPGGGLLLLPGPGCRLHRGHPLQRRPGRDRSVVQRRRPDRGLDQRAADGPARRHGGQDRPRRRHHDRRGTQQRVLSVPATVGDDPG